MDMETKIRRNIIVTNKLPTRLMKLFARELPDGIVEYYYIDRKWYYHKLIVAVSVVKQDGVNRHYIMDVKCNPQIAFMEMSADVYYGLERTLTMDDCINYLRRNYAKVIKKEIL